MKIIALACVLANFVDAQVRYPVSNDPMSYYEYDNTAGQFVTRRCAAGQTFDSLSAQCIAGSLIQQQIQQPVAFPQTQVFGPTFNFVQIPGLDTVCGTQGSVIYISGAPVTCQNPNDCTTQGGTCTGVMGGSMVVYCCRSRAATTSVTVSSGYSAACANYGSAAYRNSQIWPCDTLADISECLGLQRGSCQRDSAVAALRWYCCFQSSTGSGIIPIGDTICQTFGYVVRENNSLAPCYNCMTKYGGFCLMNNADQQWYCCSWTRQPYVYSNIPQASVSNRSTCPDNTIGNMCDSNMQCPTGFVCSNYVCCPYNPAFVQSIVQRCPDGSTPMGSCSSSGGCNIGYNCEAGFVCCASRIQQQQQIVTSFTGFSNSLPLTNDYCPVGMTAQVVASGQAKDCRQNSFGDCAAGYSCQYGAIRGGYYCCR